jgi:hypothetical protein
MSSNTDFEILPDFRTNLSILRKIKISQPKKQIQLK